jgi:polysaccharide export outer membrane protein
MTTHKAFRGFRTQPFRPLSWALLGVLALNFAACVSPKSFETAATSLDLPEPVSLQFDYLVGPGDVLRVNVAGEPDLSSTPYKPNVLGSPVDGSGSIQLPLMGAIPVAGKTVFQIKEDLESRLLKYLKRPSADVAVVEFGSKRFYVLGEVRQPGAFILDRPLTALQALSLTGGFLDDANREQVLLVRGPLQPENMVLFNAEALATDSDFLIAAGDLIFISRRRWSGIGQIARDFIPILQLLSLPIGTARDVALFQDIRDR